MHSVGDRIEIKAGTSLHKTLRETLKRLGKPLDENVPAVVAAVHADSRHYPYGVIPELDMYLRNSCIVAAMKHEVVSHG